MEIVQIIEWKFASITSQRVALVVIDIFYHLFPVNMVNVSTNLQ